MHFMSPQTLERILERIRGLRVLVVGDLMLDVYLRGEASRISPEAPVPVVHVQEEWRALGGAGNVAHNIVALGAQCSLAGAVGEDVAGLALREELAAAGVDGAGVTLIDGRPTSVKTRVLVRGQQVARYDREDTSELAPDAATQLARAVERLAAGADVLVLEDYDKGVLVPAVIDAALDAARRRDIPVVVDPKARHFFDYRGATVFKPNRPELEAALRAPVRAEDPAWLETTRRHLDCSHLLVTLGADGMALMTESGEFARVQSVARSVYDVSGAGDTVTAVVALALAAGARMEDAALLANHAAAIEVGKSGVATVSPDELRAALGESQPPKT